MNNIMKILWLFYLLISISFASMPVFAALTVQLEQDRISVNETVQLQVEIDRQVTDGLDTRPLERDFVVLANLSNNRGNLVNGQASPFTTWAIRLAPKRSGSLTIPSLEVAGIRSQSLTLQVSESSVGRNRSSGASIFIETEVDPETPYVQGMARYTVRVFYAAMLTMARVSEPELNIALVRQIGKDHEYTVNREGRRYQVVERQYAVLPQQSGQMVIPAPVLDGTVVGYSIARQRRNFHAFGQGAPSSSFATNRSVRIRGEAKMLSVQPRPAEMHSADWLPAEQVELDEEWQSLDNMIHVGDSLQRSVVVRARGVVGEQLPDVDPGSVDGFKVYLNTTKTDTRDVKNNIEGVKSRNMTFMPTHTGQFTIPAIYLQWWDTHDNQARVAQLPERTVKVLPVRNTEILSSQSKADLSANNQLSAVSDSWPWIVSFIFALLWLITVGLWWRSNRYRVENDRKIAAASSFWQPSQVARTQFLAACKANDAGIARRRLLEWAAAHWPDNPPTGLASLARRFNDPAIQDALNTLDRSLYCNEHGAWDGSQLGKLIQKLPANQNRTMDKNVLPDLYEQN
jgi:BatD DUF11 like domain